MKAPENILDALHEAVIDAERFMRGTIIKRRFEGAHGPGSTHDLLFSDEHGRTYKITAELQPEPDNYGVSTGS
jgi:hypothetical protein